MQETLNQFDFKILDEDFIHPKIMKFKGFCCCWFCHGIMKGYNLIQTFEIKFICIQCKEILIFGYMNGIKYMNENKIEKSKFQKKLNVGSVKDIIEERRNK